MNGQAQNPTRQPATSGQSQLEWLLLLLTCCLILLATGRLLRNGLELLTRADAIRDRMPNPW